MTIPDVVAANQARFTVAVNNRLTEIEDNHVIDTDENVTNYDAKQIASEEFDIVGALAAIAHGDAEFKAGDEESQAMLDGMEHAFQAGRL